MFARDEYGDFGFAPKSMGYEDYPASMVLEILQKDRNCDDFRPWNLGFTPKEHREMLDRERMLRFEEERRRSDHRWRIAELLILGPFMAIVILASAIVGALISKG